jgi:hypothetical protein
MEQRVQLGARSRGLIGGHPRTASTSKLGGTIVAAFLSILRSRFLSARMC